MVVFGRKLDLMGKFRRSCSKYLLINKLNKKLDKKNHQKYEKIYGKTIFRKLILFFCYNSNGNERLGISTEYLYYKLLYLLHLCCKNFFDSFISGFQINEIFEFVQVYFHNNNKLIIMVIIMIIIGITLYNMVK